MSKARAASINVLKIHTAIFSSRNMQRSFLLL